MEQEIEHLWKFCYWGFGLCSTGFFVLAGWLWWMVGKMSQKVSHQWLEEKFEKDIKEDMDKVVRVLSEIKDALIGDFQHKGAITRLHDVEKDVASIKEKVFHHANGNQ